MFLIVICDGIVGDESNVDQQYNWARTVKWKGIWQASLFQYGGQTKRCLVSSWLLQVVNDFLEEYLSGFDLAFSANLALCDMDIRLDHHCILSVLNFEACGPVNVIKSIKWKISDRKHGAVFRLKIIQIFQSSSICANWS